MSFSITVISTQVIRNLIRQSDLDGLEKVVLDGHGSKLIGENASDSKIRTFIRAIPSYLVRRCIAHRQNFISYSQILVILSMQL